MTQEGTIRKLAAIFSADVKEYSRLMSQDERGTIRTLTAYKEAMSSLIEEYKGRVVDAPGDNLLAEFGSVVDAVNCAVEIQRELSERNAELPYSRRMEFRIGINLGDIIEEEKRIYGDGVNIAARLESLAEGGGICISGNVHEQVKSRIGLEYEYLGEQAVKNIPEPVHVYRVLSFPGAAAHRVVKAKEKEGKKWRKAAMAIALVLIVAAAAVAVWQFYLRPSPPSVAPASMEKMAFPLPDKPSIAVLPFENLSDDPAQENIVDGITDGIITGLSQTPEMFVIARNSVFRYKGKPVEIRQVSEELGVRYVLEGSIQKAGDRLRINAQLIDAITGRHLWAERYDRDLKDLFALQDDLTMKIITSLQLKLTEGVYARMLAKGTNDIEAYLKCLQAIQLFRIGGEENNLLARKMFKEVIALDPRYPMGYIYLGWTHNVDARYRWSKSPKEDLARAEELAQKAIELDDSLGIPHRLLADIYRNRRQWDKCLEEAERAVSLDPNPMNMYGMAENLRMVGRPEESIAWYKKAIRLDPMPPAYILIGLGWSYFQAERFEDALVEFKRVLERSQKGDIGPIWPNLALASTYAMLGQEEEARNHTEEVLKINPKYNCKRWENFLAYNYKNQTDIDRVINALRKAGLPEEPPLPLPDKPSIAVLPFTNISDDPKQEYFVDGMTEDLITDLSKISGLFVIARNSAFQYKGKPVDVKKISRELGVRYLLEGSVRRADNQVRINAQLIDSTTGRHLWAERYDGKMDDIFALQDQINQKIVTALALKLTTDEKEEVSRKYTDNPAAYDALLKGMAHYHKFTGEDFAKAATYFEKAVELDPDYGRAYAALAAVYWWSTEPRWESVYLGASITEAPLWPRRYMQMAKKNPSPTMHRVAVEMFLRKRLYKEAIAEAEHALALDPNNAESHRTMARALIFDGRPEEALDFMKTAMRLDPLYPATYLWDLGLAHFCMGQYEKTVTSLERAMTLNPEAQQFSGVLAAAYAYLGRDEQAREALEKYRGIRRIDLGDLMYRHPFKDPETAERFANGFLKAGMPGRPSGYYKIYEENKLAGEEIRKLVFGQKVSIVFPLMGYSRVTRTIDDKATIESVPVSGRGKSWIGKSWIEDDMLCDKWEETLPLFGGFEWCGTVFRNPEYKSEMFDEYLWVTDLGVCTFSLVE